MKSALTGLALIVSLTYLCPSALQARAKKTEEIEPAVTSISGTPEVPMSLGESKTEIKMDLKTEIKEEQGGINKDGGIELPFRIYTEKGAKAYFTPSGWMGDFRDIRFNDAFKINPRSGKSCIQIKYTAERKNGAGWAGIYWQNPANNWGDKKGGYNLSKAKKLYFWARGMNGGEKIAEFKLGGINGTDFPGDSDSVSIGPIELTNRWRKYQIDLEGHDLSYIIGGFAFSASADDNPEGFTIFLDDIYIE